LKKNCCASEMCTPLLHFKIGHWWCRYCIPSDWCIVRVRCDEWSRVSSWWLQMQRRSDVCPSFQVVQQSRRLSWWQRWN